VYIFEYKVKVAASR